MQPTTSAEHQKRFEQLKTAYLSAHYRVVMNGEFETKKRVVEDSSEFVWDVGEFVKWYEESFVPYLNAVLKG